MKALVIGGSGQLGLALSRSAPSDATVTALDRSALDLLEGSDIVQAVTAQPVDVVINAAAYTRVDQAESESATAYAVNDLAVGEIAGACAARGVRFVHVSTDFIFDGVARHPYAPDDTPNPLNVYGASKLAGERRMESTADLDWRIIRTAWVYSASGRNFVLTMLRMFEEHRQVRVVADQVGTPTSASSLAECVWRVASHSQGKKIYHFTDAGVASWYDFAVAIYEESRALGLIANDVEIVPISTDQYPTAARRPAYSVLDKSATWRDLDLKPVHWRTRLRDVLRELAP